MSVEVGLLLAVFLLVGNAFFVGAEFSLVSVRRSAIEPLAAAGSRSALITLRALENISVLMAGAQLGITLCSLGLGAIAEPAIAHMLEGPFHAINMPEHLLHPVSFAIALLITVFLHVVIGEMVPKNIALARPEKSAQILAPALVAVVKVLSPIILLLNHIANGILKLFKVVPKSEVASTYTRDEMADLVKESRKEGYLSEDNESLLSGALTFDAQSVEGVIIPLRDVKVVTQNTTYAELEDVAAKTGFSRFPVANRKGELIGYVHIKDILQNDAKARDERLDKRKIRKLITISVDQSIRMTLKTMQHGGAHIALATKSGQVHGIVTLEDVLEELIGEL